MKKLIFICGANGIGKSRACKRLNQRLEGSALVDSDFCRLIQPFEFSDEIKDVITKNMSDLLINYFSCSVVENVIFLYGFHGPRKQIYDAVLERLAETGIAYRFVPIILECSLEENIRRAEADGRSPQRIQYGLDSTREQYRLYDYPRIDISSLTIDETVDGMIELIQQAD